MDFYSFTKFTEFIFRRETSYKFNNPFVNEIRNLTKDDSSYYEFSFLKLLKRQLLLDKRLINVEDLGSGSKSMKSNFRKISSIAKNSVSSQWQCEFLFKFINHFNLKKRIEIGTSLGIATLYQYLPIKNAEMITLEGCKETADIAQNNFNKINSNKIKLIRGNFDTTLEAALDEFNYIDYAFIDGNHTESATLKYFHLCKSRCNKGAFIVIDDIYWSKGMNNAWNKIIAENSWITFDFFHFGIVYFEDINTGNKHFKIKPPINSFL